MKKLKIVGLVIVLILLFTSCNSNQNIANAKPESSMIKIESGDVEGLCYTIFADKETKVMYIFTQSSYKGGLTVMLNSDGTPKLYE